MKRRTNYFRAVKRSRPLYQRMMAKRHQTYMEALYILQNPPEESFFGVDRSAAPNRLSMSGLANWLPKTSPSRAQMIADMTASGLLDTATAIELLKGKP
jgi:hypothetical protein